MTQDQNTIWHARTRELGQPLCDVDPVNACCTTIRENINCSACAEIIGKTNQSEPRTCGCGFILAEGETTADCLDCRGRDNTTAIRWVNEYYREPELQGGTVRFTQDTDSCDNSDGPQLLKVTVEDAGAGKYLVLETERWACDSAEEMARLLRRVEAMFGMKTKESP